MPLQIQSTGQSLTEAADHATALDIEIPVTTVREDLLAIVVSIDAANVQATVNGWEAAYVPTSGGQTLAFLYLPVNTDQQAANLRAAGRVTVNIGTTAHCMAAFCFRVTGADLVRPVEATASSPGSEVTVSHLTIPSLTPQYRRDNVLLLASAFNSLTGDVTPRATFSGAIEFAHQVSNHMPATEDDEGHSHSLALGHRTLTSAEATGQQTVSYTTDPYKASAAAFMLRSANQPPEITGQTEIAAEPGREVLMSVMAVDPDTDGLTLSWTQLEGPPVELSSTSSRVVAFTPTVPDIYRFRCLASDPDGGRSSLEVRVVVPSGASVPAGFVETEGWVNQSGVEPSPLDLASLADGDDATYLRTEDLPVGAPLTVRLKPIYGSSAITIRVRGVATNASPAVHRRLLLKEGGELRAERIYRLSTVMNTYVFRTSRAERETITDASALTLTIIDEVA